MNKILPLPINRYIPGRWAPPGSWTYDCILWDWSYCNQKSFEAKVFCFYILINWYFILFYRILPYSQDILFLSYVLLPSGPWVLKIHINDCSKLTTKIASFTLIRIDWIFFWHISDILINNFCWKVFFAPLLSSAIPQFGGAQLSRYLAVYALPYLPPNPTPSW